MGKSFTMGFTRSEIVTAFRGLLLARSFENTTLPSADLGPEVAKERNERIEN